MKGNFEFLAVINIIFSPGCQGRFVMKLRAKVSLNVMQLKLASLSSLNTGCFMFSYILLVTNCFPTIINHFVV